MRRSDHGLLGREKGKPGVEITKKYWVPYLRFFFPGFADLDLFFGSVERVKGIGARSGPMRLARVESIS